METWSLNHPKIVWIHCNRCFRLFTEQDVYLSLLSCKHILCEVCLDEMRKRNAGENVCLFCKKTVQTLKISDDMNSKYKRYFHPNPHYDMRNFDVILFQEKHRDHLDQGILRIAVLLNTELKELVKMKRQKEKQLKILELLKQCHSKYEKYYEKLRRQKAELSENSQDNQIDPSNGNDFRIGDKSLGYEMFSSGLTKK